MYETWGCRAEGGTCQPDSAASSACVAKKVQPMQRRRGRPTPGETSTVSRMAGQHTSNAVDSERRLPTQDSLHGQFPHLPKSFLRPMHQHRFQEHLQGGCEFRHWQPVHRFISQYAIHGSVLRSRLVVSTPKHTASGGAFQVAGSLVGNQQVALALRWAADAATQQPPLKPVRP